MPDQIEFSHFNTKGISIDKAEDRLFSGHMTVEIVDKQNEFIAIDEVLKIIDKVIKVSPHISDSHTNRMVGKILSYEKSEIEGHPSVKVYAKINKHKGYTLYDEVWDKIVRKVYKGLSIGGGSKSRGIIEKDGRAVVTLSDLEIYEVAVCKSPANPLAIIDGINLLSKADTTGDRPILQCGSTTCVVSKSIPQNEDNIKVPDGDNNTYIPPSPNSYIKMTDTTTQVLEKTQEVASNPEVIVSETPVVKTDSDTSIAKLNDIRLSNTETAISAHDEKLDALIKAVGGIAENIAKLRNKNPVDGGIEMEMSPKVQNSTDVGQKVKAPNKLAPGTDAAGGIMPGDNPSSSMDSGGLRMESKAEDSGETIVEKTDATVSIKAEDAEDMEKKKEKKTDGMEDKMEKTEDATPEKAIIGKSGYAYEITKHIRPVSPDATSAENVPTAYAMMKAVENGFDETTDPKEAIRKMYERTLAGEFGTGREYRSGGY